jgi:hypothetical protein
VFYGKRVVFRRCGKAIKLLPMEVTGYTVEMDMNFGYMHDCYHPEPNRLGEGKEGSALIYDFKPTEFVTEYMAVYAIILSDDNEILYWHTADKEENVYHIQPRDKVNGYKLMPTKDGRLKLVDLYKSKEYTID